MILRRLASFFGFSSVVASEISTLRSAEMLLQVHVAQDLADGFRADHGGERVLAVLVLRAQVLVLGEELTVLERASGPAR